MNNRNTALTSAEQQARSPQAVFEQLQAGNMRYVNGTPDRVDVSALRSETVMDSIRRRLCCRVLILA